MLGQTKCLSRSVSILICPCIRPLVGQRQDKGHHILNLTCTDGKTSMCDAHPCSFTCGQIDDRCCTHSFSLYSQQRKRGQDIQITIKTANQWLPVLGVLCVIYSLSLTICWYGRCVAREERGKVVFLKLSTSVHTEY